MRAADWRARLSCLAHACTTGTAFQLVGFGLAILGLSAWSRPLALLTAGVVLFVAGGMDDARK